MSRKIRTKVLLLKNSSTRWRVRYIKKMAFYKATRRIHMMQCEISILGVETQTSFLCIRDAQISPEMITSGFRYIWFNSKNSSGIYLLKKPEFHRKEL